MKTLSSLLMAFVLLMSLPSHAASSKNEKALDDFSESKKNSLALNLGLFSAVGELGISYSRNQSDKFEFEAGVGIGLSGVQLSLMQKLTLGSAKHRFVTGLGLALGLWDGGTTLWLNYDVLGYQLRTSPTKGNVSFFLLATVGLSVGLAGNYPLYDIFPGDSCGDKCYDNDDENASSPSAGLLVPNFRLGIGVAF